MTWENKAWWDKTSHVCGGKCYGRHCCGRGHSKDGGCNRDQ